ncbi:Shootin-1 [Collichthys lucidus]|uniref:Shootin-1 n=1 Tax=Collichthys lucidus TaxID=240159 RepID=A0A4U5VBE6_COLLU|nr:Shootin-1 [Collichthys lucidus]
MPLPVARARGDHPTGVSRGEEVHFLSNAMAADELQRVSVLTELSDRAIQEFEGLQRKHETATNKCKKLEEERDEVIKKLDEFQQVTQMVIEEVSAIQENLEIERTCRESAVALAFKLNRQNCSLKRKSMMLLSQLSLETITEINLDDEEEEEESEEMHAASTVCLSPQCKTTISVEEFEALQDTLNLERDLRTEAENLARVMLVEQKQLKRQSQILKQTSSPSEALQEALSQISGLTQDLETQRLEHQNQIKQMEDRLRSCETQRALTALRRKLELVEEERREYSDKCSKTEVEVKDLRFTATNPPPTPAPPTHPPPPPPPPSAPLASNPLSSLLALIQKRKVSSTDIPLVVQDSAKTPEVDIKQQAVEEMMQRIKKGVQLRPVRQFPNRTRRQENFSRTTLQPKAVSPSTNHDEELQRILLRRRDALEPQHNSKFGLLH